MLSCSLPNPEVYAAIPASHAYLRSTACYPFHPFLSSYFFLSKLFWKMANLSSITATTNAASNLSPDHNAALQLTDSPHSKPELLSACSVINDASSDEIGYLDGAFERSWFHDDKQIEWEAQNPNKAVEDCELFSGYNPSRRSSPDLKRFSRSRNLSRRMDGPRTRLPDARRN